MRNPPKNALVRLASPPFVIAVVMLMVAIVLAGPVAAWKKFKRAKLPLPLKKALTALDVEALAPYQVVERVVLDPTVVEALGTDRYLNWVLEDSSLPSGDPLRRASLLVTYYSGGQDLVPHTPDVCFLGTGYEPAQPHENRKIEVRSLPAESAMVPIRVCTFVRTSVFQHKKHSVVYTFFCNGRAVCTRTDVRLLINNPTNTYAYFSKVEVSFPRATRAQNIEGAQKLFERLLPVLRRDHWPDFEAAEEAGETEPAPSAPDGSGGTEPMRLHREA